MDRPYRCPVIYPGEPMPAQIWVTRLKRLCVLGRHKIKPGTTVHGMTRGLVACESCANKQEAGRATS